MDRPKIAVLLPCYNEVQTIGKVEFVKRSVYMSMEGMTWCAKQSSIQLVK